MDVNRLKRYTTPTYGANTIVSPVAPQDTAKFTRLLQRGFPSTTMLPQFVEVQSRARSWNHLLTASGESIVIIDKSLIPTLADLEYLVSEPNTTPGASEALLYLLMADAFRRCEKPNQRYHLFCLLQATKRAQLLQDVRLRSTPKQEHPVMQLMPLTHEFTHMLYQQENIRTQEWLGLSNAAIRRFITALEEVLAGERQLDEISIVSHFAGSAGKAETQIDPLEYEKPIREQINALQKDPKLAEELTCDLLAAIAILSIVTNSDIAKDFFSRPLPLSGDQLGDLFYSAASILNLMQIISGIETFCSNVANGESLDTLSDLFRQITARTNATVYVLNSFYDLSFSMGLAHSSNRAYEALAQDEKKQILLKSLRVGSRAVDKAIYNPLQQLMDVIASPQSFEIEIEAALSHYYPNDPPDFSSDKVAATLRADFYPL